MGGRLCLRTALDHPDDVRALVLIGATPGIEDSEERRERQRADAALAERLEHIGLDAFVAGVARRCRCSPGLPSWARFDRERRTNTAAGLAASLRNAGTGSMEPLWDRLDGLDIPVLCVTGSVDERYATLATRMVGRIGSTARHGIVEGAGHAAHLERPDAVIGIVTAFLDEAATDLPTG